MPTVQLKVQPFDGLEVESGDFPWCRRVNTNTWEIDSLDLWDLRREISSGDLGDTTESTLLRRLCGAVDKALKDTGGWKRPSSIDAHDIRQQASGRDLASYGLVATCYTETADGGHATIELRFSDGTQISVPVYQRVLWCSCPFIIKTLNEIDFQGGGWTDKSDWGVFDHLLSHGH